MNWLQLVEILAWIGALALISALLRDAWLTGHRYDERLLTSSREGEIEADLREVAAGLEAIEEQVDQLTETKP
jgi:hypothetical protein